MNSKQGILTIIIVLFAALPLISRKNNPNPNSSMLANEKKCEKNDSKACNANYEYLSTVEGNQRDALVYAQKSCELRDYVGCFGAAFIYSKYMANLDQAFEYFEKGLNLGYDNWAYLETETPLKLLKTDPRYIELIQKYKRVKNDTSVR